MAYDTTIIVVRPTLRAQAEAACVAADPEGGAGTFNPGVPLRAVGDTTNTVVAYWANWHMQPGQRAAFASSLGGPVSTYRLGQAPHLGRNRWMFDATPGQWTPDAVLAALGLEPPVHDS